MSGSQTVNFMNFKYKLLAQIKLCKIPTMQNKKTFNTHFQMSMLRGIVTQVDIFLILVLQMLEKQQMDINKIIYF